MSRTIISLSAAATLLGTAGLAGAQDALTQHTETVVAPAVELPRQLVINLGAGGTYNSGNTDSIAANAGGQLSYKKDDHQLALEALGTVSFADDPAIEGTDYERNAGSVIGRGRYDLFLSRSDALFVALAPRRDVNAGLDLRLQNQVGYLRNLFYPGDDHRLWLEAGYDLTYDNFAELTQTLEENVTADAPMLAIDDQGNSWTVKRTRDIVTEPDPEIVHSIRLFFGYNNRLSELATASLGLETLLEPQDLANVRMTGVADLSSSVSSRFKVGVQFRVLYDNVPVPGKEKVDTITALQLIYNYDSLAAPAAAPVCDCSAEVAAAEAACAAQSECPPPAAEPAPEAQVLDAPSVPVAEPSATAPTGDAIDEAAEVEPAAAADAQ